MSQEYQFADDDKLKKRQRQLSEFLDQMFDEEDRPYFVSDEACLYDIYSGNDEEFSNRFEKWYGRRLTESEFRLNVWKLLDSIYDS